MSEGNITLWHVVWTGGQSNSVGTNSQKNGYPTWPTTHRIQNFCWGPESNETSDKPGCAAGTFVPAAVPLYNEHNVGFSQTYANLLLRSMPQSEGIVLFNTGVGGTGFIDSNWQAPNGRLTRQSISAAQQLAEALPKVLGGRYSLHTMLWHQGECDAGDNRKDFHATYCQYLTKDIGPLIDFLRREFPGGSSSTPFLVGGMLPYWVDKAKGTGGVAAALEAINTTRAFTGYADSRIFPDFFPSTTIPDGEPLFRSGVTGDVIHFNATQAVLMGHQYFEAYHQAVKLETVVPSTRTRECTVANVPLPRWPDSSVGVHQVDASSVAVAANDAAILMRDNRITLPYSDNSAKISGFLAPTGSVYSIDVASGQLKILLSGSATTAASACSGSDDSTLLRTLALVDDKLQMQTYNKTARTLEVTDMSKIGFAKPKQKDLALGLDWYLQSGRNESDVFVAGPDELDFMHVLRYRPSGGHYNDLAQYSQGARLSRSNSAFDELHGHLWLQTVYDVSPSTNPSSAYGSFRSFLKQYDVSTGSLMNVVPDPSVAQIVVPADGQLFAIGGCVDDAAATNKATLCLWSLDPTVAIPKFRQISALPMNWVQLMPSVFSLSPGGMLHMVVRTSDHSDGEAAAPPALVCDKATNVCSRTADAVSFAEPNWAVASIQLMKGSEMVTSPRKHHNTTTIRFPPSHHFDRQHAWPTC